MSMALLAHMSTSNAVCQIKSRPGHKPCFFEKSDQPVTVGLDFFYRIVSPAFD